MVEIQVRTELQHLWAEISEKLADTYGAALKYGGGEKGIRHQLGLMSEYIDLLETIESGGASDEEEATALEQGRADVRNALLGLLVTAETRDDFSH